MDKQNIESIYPLTALQQAFLWHSLQTSVQAGLLHVRCTLVGQLDEHCFRQAWDTVIVAHPALRTSVHWEGVKQPLQVVARQVQLPWTVQDWREKESVDAHLDNRLEDRLEDFLQKDRDGKALPEEDRSFDLTQAPISRISLIRLTDSSYELVWTCHHLMLDGWSSALVLNQVVDAYEALSQGQSPVVSSAPTFQSYVRWQQQQDSAATKAFWQEALTGFEHPASRLFWQNAEGPLCADEMVMTREETAAVNAFLRSHRLTLNTLMQGVWSLLLRGYSQTSDVLFGSTVSGRQCDLPGVESIVGLLINVLPVRVNVSESETVIDWLQTLQRQQVAVVPYAHTALSDIQQWCGLPGRLFDSLLVIENYPIRTASAESSLRLENLKSGVVSTYGLTVLVKPGESLVVAAESAAVTTEVLTHLLTQFSQLLNAIVETPQVAVAEILASGDFSRASLISIQTKDDVDSSVTDSSISRDDSEVPLSMPRSPLELSLLKIWSSVLGTRQQRSLGVDDSFFDWGGSSLLAVQLFNEMQRQLECALPLATLFQAPTVSEFAVLLAQSQSGDTPATKWSSLVPIQPNGAQRPFFFHGGSADALTWARFSQLLGADQPFYAFQRPDLDGRKVTMLTVEELAADCVKELRMLQPEGPYIVGGHCFGGAVALEMAQQLQALGQRVDSVVLIDAYRPEVLPSSRRIQLQTQLNLGLFWLRKNYYYYGNRKDLKRLPAKLWEKVRGRLGSADTTIQPSEQPSEAVPSQSEVHLASESEASESEAFESGVSGAAVPNSYEARYAQAIAANDWAAARYQATEYKGTLKLFRAKIQMLEWYFGESLGWQTLVKDRLQTTFIPGFFGNLFNQRAAPILAEQVKTYLSTLPPAPMPDSSLASQSQIASAPRSQAPISPPPA